MTFELPKNKGQSGINFKSQYNPLHTQTHRFWIMSEIEAEFNLEGLLIGFKVIRSFKQMSKEDKKPKEEKKREELDSFVEDEERI